MRANELIELIQAQQAKYGDIDILIDHEEIKTVVYMPPCEDEDKYINISTT